MGYFDLFLDIALICFLFLTILNYRAQRSVLYPPFIFCAMWLLDLTIYRISPIEIDSVHGNTLAIVAAGAASFSVGGLLAGLTPRALLRIYLFRSKPKRTTDFHRNMLMIVLLCGLAIVFYHTWQLSNLHGGDSNILRQAHLEMGEEIPDEKPGGSAVLVYVSTLMTNLATSASLLFATEKKDWKFWVATIIAFLVCILSTARTGILLLISGLSAIRLLQTKRESLLGGTRLLRWPIALFVTLWIGLIFTTKSSEDVTGGVAEVATRFLVGYIAGPLAAFDSVVQHPADFMMTSSHTFQFPLMLAAALHLTIFTRPPMLDSFIPVPFPMNVYTVFKFYFLELGTIGTLVLLFFAGLLHSLLYLKARQGGRFSTYLFAYSVYTVLMVIFDDRYFLSGIYPTVFAFGLLYFLIGSVQFRLFPANRQRATLLTNRP